MSNSGVFLRSWTAADREVTCRQLGFSGGYFYEWQQRPNNDTSTLLFEAPSCAGRESELTQCAWHTHAMGGGVCGECGSVPATARSVFVGELPVPGRFLPNRSSQGEGNRGVPASMEEPGANV